MIMEWFKIKIVVVFISLFQFEGKTQNSFLIHDACIRDGRLSVTFVNPSKSTVLVPCLSYRYKLGAEEKYLDEQFFEVRSDTLVITLLGEHPVGLIDHQGTKAKNSKVEFNDFSLKPTRKYKTHIRLNIPYKDIRFLELRYENNIGFKQLCIK